MILKALIALTICYANFLNAQTLTEFFSETQLQEILAQKDKPYFSTYDTFAEAQGIAALDIMEEPIFAGFGEFRTFDALCVMRGFLDRRGRSESLAGAYLRTQIRRVGDWEKVRDANGRVIYNSVDEIDENGDVIPTTVDASEIEAKETQNAIVKIPNRFASPYTMSQILERRGDIVVAAAINRTPIKAVGMNIAEKGAIRSISYLFPHGEGWYFYAASFVDLSGVANDSESADSICSKLKGTYNWLDNSLR